MQCLSPNLIDLLLHCLREVWALAEPGKLDCWKKEVFHVRNEKEKLCVLIRKIKACFSPLILSWIEASVSAADNFIYLEEWNCLQDSLESFLKHSLLWTDVCCFYYFIHASWMKDVSVIELRYGLEQLLSNVLPLSGISVWPISLFSSLGEAKLGCIQMQWHHVLHFHLQTWWRRVYSYEPLWIQILRHGNWI